MIPIHSFCVPNSIFLYQILNILSAMWYKNALYYSLIQNGPKTERASMNSSHTHQVFGEHIGDGAEAAWR